MPKGQKQKTSVKKKKQSTQKKKPVASKKRNNKLLSNPTTKEASSQTAIADNTIAVSQINPVETEESEFKIEDFANVSQERASILSIVKGLEGQVETAFKLKEVLEAELDTTQKKLAEELEARTQLEMQIASLEAQTALSDQLREDISFVEEERNKFANLLAQTQSQLEEVTSERDCLAEQIASVEENVKKLEGEKMALEAQVMNLKDKIIDADRLRKELMEMTKAQQGSREQVHDLTRRLEASETSKDALEGELAGTHQNARTLREEVEDLREKVASADSRTADMRIQLEDQQVVNRELMETNTHLENEIKMTSINYEAARNELNSFKNALRDIRSEATRTSGRVRQRYFKPNNTSNSNQKTRTKQKRSRPLSAKV